MGITIRSMTKAEDTKDRKARARDGTRGIIIISECRVLAWRKGVRPSSEKRPGKSDEAASRQSTKEEKTARLSNSNRGNVWQGAQIDA